MAMLVLILSLFINNNSLEEKVQNYLSKHLNNYQKFEYEILSAPKISGVIEFRDDKEFYLNKNMVYIPVIVSKQNNGASSFISVKVKLFKYVLTANQYIKPKTELNKSLFEERLVDITTIKGTAIENIDELLTMRNKSLLSAGEVLTLEEVETLPVVFTGDEVTAEKNIGSVTITVQAFVREDGGLNDKIKIRTVDNKQFTAKVVNRKKVFIEE